jgi:ATP-dependent RNA helicase DDX24/MAK5
MVQKRKRSAVANVPVKKRKQATAAKSSKSSKPKRVVDANSLAWKPVDLPEMFNDAEGFFGLEEISGVDVVRSGNMVKFVSHLLCYFCDLINQRH